MKKVKKTLLFGKIRESYLKYGNYAVAKLSKTED